MTTSPPDDTLPPLLERLRVAISAGENNLFDGKAVKLFEFLDNNGGITEQYLYEHQPTGGDTVSVYSTSPSPVGRIDLIEAESREFSIVEGPAILVARKGYAGRMSVIEDGRFIVHEDGYAVRPNKEWTDSINLWWFAGHYSAMFQASRTSSWGIGDFPREKFKAMRVSLPSRAFQDRVEPLYRRRAALVEMQRNARNFVEDRVMAMVLDK